MTRGPQKAPAAPPPAATGRPDAANASDASALAATLAALAASPAGEPRPGSATNAEPWAVPVPITEVESSDERRARTGNEPLDRVLGGGFVPGHLIMLSGDPGAGKSTLLAQVAGTIPCDSLLYATGEESIQSVADRARRVGAAHPRIRVIGETIVERLAARVVEIGAQVLVVDSIQTLVSSALDGMAGTVQQVNACITILRALSRIHAVTTIAIVHVTKGGEFAGPRTLEHMIDVALHLEKTDDSEVRTLRSNKNRGGPTWEVGYFLMTERGLEPLDPLGATGRADAEPEPDSMLPIAQELCYRVLELGGVIDDGLRDRIGGRLDLAPRSG